MVGPITVQGESQSAYKKAMEKGAVDELAIHLVEELAEVYKVTVRQNGKGKCLIYSCLQGVENSVLFYCSKIVF